jgi:hypothetical protein
MASFLKRDSDAAPADDPTGPAGEDDAAGGIVAHPRTQWPSGGSELKRSVSEATRKIEQIVDAAERVAHEIRTDAEAQASRYLEERRHEADRLVEERAGALSETVRPVVQRVEHLREQAVEVTREVEQALTSLRGLSAGASYSGETAPPEAHRETGPEVGQAFSQGVVEPGDGGRPTATAGGAGPGETATGRPQVDAPSLAAEARLRATQMAVAGSGRVEIEATLRGELGIADPTPIVDEILGYGY